MILNKATYVKALLRLLAKGTYQEYVAIIREVYDNEPYEMKQFARAIKEVGNEDVNKASL